MKAIEKTVGSDGNEVDEVVDSMEALHLLCSLSLHKLLDLTAQAMASAKDGPLLPQVEAFIQSKVDY